MCNREETTWDTLFFGSPVGVCVARFTGDPRAFYAVCVPAGCMGHFGRYRLELASIVSFSCSCCARSHSCDVRSHAHLDEGWIVYWGTYLARRPRRGAKGSDDAEPLGEFYLFHRYWGDIICAFCAPPTFEAGDSPHGDDADNNDDYSAGVGKCKFSTPLRWNYCAVDVTTDAALNGSRW